MNSVVSESLIFLLCLNLFIISTVRCATFENITVTVDKETIIHHNEDKKEVFISSANTLAEYFAEEPYNLLYIQDQKIPTLEKNSVANLPKMKYIYINRCGISDIEPEAFKNLPNVNTLDLSENNIEVIRDGVFTDLEVKNINLSSNKLSEWNGQWVRGSTIRSITLNKNFIEEIPENSLAYLKPGHNAKELRVMRFQVDDNKVKRIHPKAFNGVSVLYLLGMSKNLLKEVPVEVFRNVRRISSINFSNNKFSCFPLEIANVTEIKDHVNLLGNPLKCDCVNNWIMNISEARKIFKDEDLDTYQNNCLIE